MSKNEIQNMIITLSNQTAPNSITPAMVANILQGILDALPSGTTAQPTVGNAIYERGKNIEYFFGNTVQKTSTAAVECPIVLDDDSQSFHCGQIVDINTNNENAPLVRAVEPCFVEITGYLTVRANESYTSDRIFRLYKVDMDGERIDGQTNIIHFTGTTQIFSVPINYMTFMMPDEIMHLTTFSSSGTTTISANSWLNIKAVPVKM